MCRLLGWAARAPRTAVLIDSVPPLVKNKASAATPSNSASWDLARSTASRAPRPAPWGLEGLPNSLPKKGQMASLTLRSTGVVALLSR